MRSEVDANTFEEAKVQTTSKYYPTCYLQVPKEKVCFAVVKSGNISLTKNPNFASPGLGQTDFISLLRWCKRKWKKAPCNIHAGPPGNKIQDNGVWVRETLVPIPTRGSNQRIKKIKGIWWNIIHAHSLVSGV